MLSDAAWSVWGKSGFDDLRELTSWLPLAQHMYDSGSTAAELWDSWLPRNVTAQVVAAFDDDPDRARATATFLAAVHDVGKASVAFASQVPKLASPMVELGLELPLLVPREERLGVPHSLVSHITLQEWLTSRHGWEPESARRLAVVVGGHHGVQPTTSSVQFARSHPQLVGTGPWDDIRLELLDEMSRHSGFDVYAKDWCGSLNQQMQVLLTALVIVSDWIASSTDLFPMIPVGHRRPSVPNSERTGRALGRLGLPTPWAPSPSALTDPVDVLLRSRFDLGPQASARPVQQAAVNAARALTGPGLIVIEAPTGEGKTEAALMAAEVMAVTCGSGGCFVALPTQATSDAMFSRVLGWLSRLPDAVVDVGSTAHSVALLHGKAGLNRAFRDLSWVPSPQSVGLDEIDGGDRLAQPDASGEVEAYVHSWLSGRKKAALAEFTVGTIDQLLFTSLKSRHLPLRHLGLAGKVLILDEVHAVDVYMDTYLLRAIEWCGAYGVPVIALSATLPRAQRNRLHTAYAAGRSASVTAPPGPKFVRRAWGTSAATGIDAPSPPAEAQRAPSSVYPVVTASAGAPDGEVTVLPIPRSSRSVDITVELLDDSPAALVALLERDLVDGGCALVVQNTVSRATAVFDELRATFGDEVRLMHSRFISLHRSENDTWLRESFGPPRGGEGGGRPRRSIVVATQVVEQSLDIDFDLLVTDLAPMDLLIQRMGRVHRHERPGSRPPRLRHARCFVRGVEDWSASPPRAVAGSRRIYGEHLLLRTAALLGVVVEHGGVVSSPADVAPLVQATYDATVLGPPTWQARMDRARTEDLRRAEITTDKAKDFLLAAPRPDGHSILGWIDRGVGEADEDSRGRAQVRDSDDSFEVILVKRQSGGGGGLTLLETVSVHDEPVTYFNTSSQPRAIAEVVAACAVRIPGYFSHDSRWDVLLDTLERDGYFVDWQRDPLLRGQLVLVLDEDQTATVGGFTFHYSRGRGFEVSRA